MISCPMNEALKALSDPNRIKIVEMLLGGEVCACKLMEELDISQPTLSHHMGILYRAGIVDRRKDGQWVHYSVNKGSLGQLRDYFDSLSERAGRSDD
jgi:ArsR family transcriptional regulator